MSDLCSCHVWWKHLAEPRLSREKTFNLGKCQAEGCPRAANSDSFCNHHPLPSTQAGPARGTDCMKKPPGVEHSPLIAACLHSSRDP